MSIINTVEDVIQQMVEITPVGADGFRKIKETLMRIGLPSSQIKTLYQSAHILHRQGRYYICHFKEMFALDGKTNTLTEGDTERRNRIVQMLVDWNLIEPVDPSLIEPMGRPGIVKVIKYSDKDDWTLVQKYAIGTRKDNFEEADKDD